jgi:hypothetical protein
MVRRYSHKPKKTKTFPVRFPRFNPAEEADSVGKLFEQSQTLIWSASPAEDIAWCAAICIAGGPAAEREASHFRFC